MTTLDEPDWIARSRSDSHQALAEADTLAEGLERAGNGQPPVGPPQNLTALLRASLLTADEVERLPAPEWLLDGYLVAHSLAVLYGKPGAGKSFLALDWAAHIATGTWWLSKHQVQAGPVLYLAAEGRTGMGPRITAWKHHQRLYNLEQLVFPGRHINLMQKGWPQALATVAAELQPRLVVIDTLARSMSGGDENSPRDMGLVVGAIDLILEHTTSTILLVHHGTKADGSLRGHTNLEGAADTIIEVKGAGGRLIVTIDKQKDSIPVQPLRLTLAPTLDSAALTDQAPVGVDELTDNARVALEALERGDIGDGMPASAWMRYSDLAESSFYDARAILANLELIEKTEPASKRSPWRVSDQGKQRLAGDEPDEDF